jgi:hypothetical protein
MLGFRRRPKVARDDSQARPTSNTVTSAPMTPPPPTKKSLWSALAFVASVWSARRSAQKAAPSSAPTQPGLSERPTPQARPRSHSQGRTDDWTGRLLGELFFFLIGLATWLLNALFTVLGLTEPFGLNLISGAIALCLHILLSRAELYLWYRWYDPRYLLGLFVCVAIDAGTTTSGLVGLLAQRAPTLLGTVPHDPWEWRIIASTVYNNAVSATQTPLPDYTARAVIVFCIALAFALGSERLLRAYYHGLRETWAERHPIRA